MPAALEDNSLLTIGRFLREASRLFAETATNDILRLDAGLRTLSLAASLVAYEREEETWENARDLESRLEALVGEVERSRREGVWQKTHVNLHSVFGIKWLESAHSDFLAWMLDPKESHCVSDQFISAFVSKFFGGRQLPYLSANVTRERQEGGERPDIVVEGADWYLVIENKVRQSESENQTPRYADRWRGKARTVLMAFVTRYGDEPQSDEFVPVSYREIRELLENIDFKGDAGTLVGHFAEHIFLDLER